MNNCEHSSRFPPLLPTAGCSVAMKSKQPHEVLFEVSKERAVSNRPLTWLKETHLVFCSSHCRGGDAHLPNTVTWRKLWQAVFVCMGIRKASEGPSS